MFPPRASQTQLLSLAAITVPNRPSLHFTPSPSNLQCWERKKEKTGKQKRKCKQRQRCIVHPRRGFYLKKHQPAAKNKSGLLLFLSSRWSKPSQVRCLDQIQSASVDYCPALSSGYCSVYLKMTPGHNNQSGPSWHQLIFLKFDRADVQTHRCHHAIQHEGCEFNYV